MSRNEAMPKFDGPPRVVGVGNPRRVGLADLDYSILQQCMHCGMCLPTCPTYQETKIERNSPRGRIAWMRSIADGDQRVTESFGREMYYCLGCLACVSACPAGVAYAELFEVARADVERERVLENPVRNGVRAFTIRWVFMRPRVLRWLGRSLWLYQVSGLQSAVRRLGLTRLLPGRLAELEPLTPDVHAPFSDDRIRQIERPAGEVRSRVGLLTGCVQDLVYPEVNRDTADVLLANGCEVFTPRAQYCCGSLHGHNGEPELARELARRQIDAFNPENLDAIITNAAGCGSHLKHYDRLLADDPAYATRAIEWSRKVKDIHEWLSAEGFRPPRSEPQPQEVTYHEACHLCHGQGITRPPREVLQSIPGLKLTELTESTWCCGSAGVYNITQPETSGRLLNRKLGHIARTGCGTVATSNPGCMVQLESGLRGEAGKEGRTRVRHTISLLAEAYRRESGRVPAGAKV